MDIWGESRDQSLSHGGGALHGKVAIQVWGKRRGSWGLLWVDPSKRGPVRADPVAILSRRGAPHRSPGRPRGRPGPVHGRFVSLSPTGAEKVGGQRGCGKWRSAPLLEGDLAGWQAMVGNATMRRE